MNGESSEKQIDASLTHLIQRNVEAISRLEQATQSQRSAEVAVADTIARFCGTMAFVYVHVCGFLFWILWNWLVEAPLKFDPPPFTALGTVVGLEAIFLSTFILISQNSQQRIADRRNLLDLQINLLAEQENSQMLSMLQRLLEHHGMLPGKQVEILQQATDPEVLAEKIEETFEGPPE